MTKEVTKNKGGVPKRILSEEEIEHVKELAGRQTIRQIAKYFGICETSFHAIKKRRPEVLEAYEKGKVKAVDEMASLLMQKARDGDVTSMIFYLKTQGRWSEKMIQDDEDVLPNSTIGPSINIYFNQKRSAN